MTAVLVVLGMFAGFCLGVLMMAMLAVNRTAGARRPEMNLAAARPRRRRCSMTPTEDPGNAGLPLTPLVEEVAVTMTDGDEFDFTFRPRDNAGQPAQLDPTEPWLGQPEISDPTLVSLSMAPDGLSGTITSAILADTDLTGKPFPLLVDVTFKGDADLGPGVREVRGVIHVTITGGEATGLGLETSVPRPRAENQ